MLTNILEYLEASAEKYPDKTAYADDNSSLTFGELLGEAKAIGSFIIRNNIGNGPVIVYMKKSPACLAGFFGVLYAGGAYVPIDTQMPAARVTLITGNLDPAAILTDKNCEESAVELFPGKTIILMEDALAGAENSEGAASSDDAKGPDRADNSERYAAMIDEEALGRVRGAHLDTMPAYILYTSGSTGVPKGVVVSHRSLIDYMEHFCPELGIRSDDVIANQAPFYFDASLIDVYCTLKMGATMYIVPIELFSLPLRLLEFLEERKVTMIRWVPSALNMVSAFRGLKSLRPEALRMIIFGAESMPTKCFNYWRGYYPEATFVQIYGPTEITGVCTYYIVDREFENTETIPIGRAFGNSGVFLLTEDNRLITDKETGVLGEICVRGTCLAHGYYNDPERTAAVFVQNPLNNLYPEKIYKTGDLASYNEYGELVFSSRKDFQIKHMGHRIELGEIEAAVTAISGIKTAVCLFDGKKSKIHLVYTGDLTETDIINSLKDSLPRYMIPNVFHQLETLPMTASGKADRVTLKNTYIPQ